MGKEVKIGVAVISLLLVILAAVIVMRLMGGGEDAVAQQPAELSEEAPTPLSAFDPATQPTLLATSPSDARPPLTQMSPPADAEGPKWRTSSLESDADEIEPGTSFMPKGDYSSAASDVNEHVAARPRTFAGRGNRYAAAVVEDTADAATAVVDDASVDASAMVTDTDSQVVETQVVEPSTAQDELMPIAATAPAVSEVSLRESADTSEAAPMTPTAAPMASDSTGGYRRSRRNPYQASSSDTGMAPAPPAASEVPNEPPAVAETPYQAAPYPAQATPYQASPSPAVSDYQSAPQPAATPSYQSGYQAAPVAATPAPSYPTMGNSGYAAQPASQPVEQVVETRENTGKYYVEPGDSFWTISQKMYGTGGYFKALQEHNRTRFPQPSNLNIGDEVLTPPVDELREKYSGLCPKPRTLKPGTPQVQQVSASLIPSGRTYVVEEGDTLYDIAKYELGDGQRWPEIFQLNRHILSPDIDYLRPGLTLNLPASKEQRVDVLTRQPGTAVQR